LKVSGDLTESESQMSADVLEETDLGLNISHDSPYVGPEVARVVGSESSPGVAERLTGVTANNAIHDSAPRCAIEGS